MVKSRPTLINNYVNNLLKMLENSKVLNTSENKSYSEKVKDITMNNQQVAFIKYLRDYTGRGILLLKCLRYSPIFCKTIKKFYNKIFYFYKKTIKILKLNVQLQSMRKFNIDHEDYNIKLDPE